MRRSALWTVPSITITSASTPVDQSQEQSPSPLIIVHDFDHPLSRVFVDHFSSISAEVEFRSYFKAAAAMQSCA